MEGEKIFELLRGGIWRGRKQFLGSLEGGYGGGEKFFGLLRGGRWRGTKRVFPEGEKKNFPCRGIRGGRKNFSPAGGYEGGENPKIWVLPGQGVLFNLRGGGSPNFGPQGGILPPLPPQIACMLCLLLILA